MGLMMDRFLAHAEEILLTAECGAASGEPPSRMAILIGRDGGISLVADSDWTLESLRRERGAEMAFEVRGNGGRVAVEGRAPGRICRFESETPAAVARRLLGGGTCGVPQALLAVGSSI